MAKRNVSPAKTRESRWLLLIHQIPPKPNHFRVKIWRRLQGLGAVAIKNSVYALPRSEQAQEDLQWVLREVVAGGGEASLVEARFIEGLGDEQVEAMFHAARDADYAQVAAVRFSFEAGDIVSQVLNFGAPTPTNVTVSGNNLAETRAFATKVKDRLGGILTIPAVLAGVVAMLLVTGTTLDVQPLMGAIVSIGVAVANALLLVTFAGDRRRAGEGPAEAIIAAARSRKSG